MGFYGIFPIVSVLMLLTISFFVLLTVPKADSKRIKQFGRALVIAIWVTALYLAGVSIYANLKGDSCHYKKYDKYGKIKKMHRYHHKMMR